MTSLELGTKSRVMRLKEPWALAPEPAGTGGEAEDVGGVIPVSRAAVGGM